MRVIYSLINKGLHLFEIMKVKTDNKVVYLTFDDGPEEGITEFIIGELRKYNYKATFFCKGENAEKHPELLSLIKKEGHTLGNHTYSHIHGFETDTHSYVNDIERADSILQTPFFRPPWGAIKFSQFLRLQKKYKIVYWSLMSGDADIPAELLNVELNHLRLKDKTRKGDIVLFHFCKEHENETKQILTNYLRWLSEQGFVSKGL